MTNTTSAASASDPLTDWLPPAKPYTCGHVPGGICDGCLDARLRGGVRRVVDGTAIVLPSGQPTFRHLAVIVTPYPDNRCEMGDEDECPNRPTHWLTAPASYIVPMMLCDEHVKAEHTYFGTSIPGDDHDRCQAAGVHVCSPDNSCDGA